MPVTVSKGGRIPGTKLSVVDYGEVLALVRSMTKPVQRSAGILKGRTSLTRALLREHRKERAR